MRFVVLEPTGRERRVDSRRATVHGRRAGLGRTDVSDRLAETSEPQLELDRDRLDAVRRRVAADPWMSADALRQTLRREDILVETARDGAGAADAIARFAPSQDLIANNSAAVKEISADLDAAGLRLHRDYPGRDLPVSEQVVTRGWQLPDDPGAIGWNAFQERLPRPATQGRNLKAVTALLGVSVAAADGTFFWVQHFANIARALDEADHLVLLVPVDKVVASVEEARLQSDVAAAHGWAARILDGPGTKDDSSASRIWEMAGRGTPPRRVLVVLLDNGRSGWAGTHTEQLLRCISCRACRQNCPTQRYFGGDLEMSPVEYLRYYQQGLHDELSLCVGCGNCRRSCPVDIDVPGLIARARSTARRPHSVLDFAVSNPELLGRVGRIALAGSSGGWSAGPAARLAGIHPEVRMPPYGAETFDSWYERRKPPAGGRRVVFYAGCFVNYNDLEQGMASVRLLEATGHEVVAPRMHCCDIAKLQAGDWEGARRSAERNVALLEEASGGDAPIVTGCPSCARALVDFYPELLGETGSRLAARVEELFHYLKRAGLVEAALGRRTEGRGTADSGGGSKLEIFYHSPCHYPAVDPSRSVIGMLEDLGASVAEAGRGCCGMSGSFGLKSRSHDMSMQVGADLFERVSAERKDHVVATNCGACRLQIQQGTDRPVVHPAVIVERLTRGGER